MNVTIEHPFCPYCSEVTNLYFRIINTLLFSKDENELRTSMESLKKETRLDEYFTFGYGAHHLWICQRKPSNKNKIFPHRIMCAITTDSLHYLAVFLRSSGRVVPPLGAGRSPTDELKSVNSQ